MTKAQDHVKISPFSFKEDKLYDRIADTYFHQKIRPKTRKKKHTNPLENLAVIAKPLAVLCMLLILAVCISFLSDRHIGFIKQKIDTADIVSVIKGGVVNREVLKNVSFGGYAKIGSRTSKDYILLNNPKKYNWADMTLDLRFPINLSSRNISIWLKGNSGGERVSVVVKDAFNRSVILKELYAVPGWKMEKISLKAAKSNIDLTKIKHIRLEYGYVGESPKDADSPIDLTVYIKDIEIAKET